MASRVESAEQKEEGSMIDSEEKEKARGSISPLWHHVVTRNARALSLIIIIVLIIEQLLPFLLCACGLMSTLGTEGHLIRVPTSTFIFRYGQGRA